MGDEHERLVKFTVFLEEEAVDALAETSRELERETGQKWSRGAVVRLALSDFFTRRGRMI